MKYKVKSCTLSSGGLFSFIPPRRKMIPTGVICYITPARWLALPLSQCYLHMKILTIL